MGSRREPVRLDECLTQAVARCQARHPGRVVQAAFGNVPDKLDTTFAVAGNTQLLTTALLNLLDNACKYSAAEVRATLGYTDPKTVQVAVADTGIGMAPNDLARVFEPLYRVENGRQ